MAGNSRLKAEEMEHISASVNREISFFEDKIRSGQAEIESLEEEIEPLRRRINSL